MESARLENGLTVFGALLKQGTSPEDARAVLQGIFDTDETAAIWDTYLERTAASKAAPVSGTMLQASPGAPSFYPGPDHQGAIHWPAYRNALKGKWNPVDIEALNAASTQLMHALPHPGTTTFGIRGLVVGHVQSGKTSNFAALITKAADWRYRFFIVLSGLTTALRRQTEERLRRDIVQHNTKAWHTLTAPENDFHGAGNPDALFSSQTQCVVAVVKKNAFVLDRLARFLEATQPGIRAVLPTLIIDDEADNASINTSDGADRTAINAGILRIFKALPRTAYVGYTATPFANVFIDPTNADDLFPRDFIRVLDAPQSYFGATRVFGRPANDFDPPGANFDGEDVVRRVPDEELAELQPKSRADKDTFVPSVPNSLKDALAYFLVATAARYARGHDDHSSMLVHTSLYTAVHTNTETVVTAALDQLKKPSGLGLLKSAWAKENGRELWGEIAKHLPMVFKRARVVIDNGESEGLDYRREDEDHNPLPPAVIVALGGNTLSRGLTLEGLVVSYFVRTAGAYDTLLQMGRWFGYRIGYEDLPRIWMTDESCLNFMFLAGAESELREEMRQLEKEGKTPLESKLRIRRHCVLAITAANKSRSMALETFAFGSEHYQSFLFQHHDAAWLKKNLDAGEVLVKSAAGSSAEETPVAGSSLFRKVGLKEVRKFLSDYRFHEGHALLRNDLLLKYLDAQEKLGGLKAWNLVVVGLQCPVDAPHSTQKLGPLLVNCVERTRLPRGGHCNIKVLTTQRDRVLDLPEWRKVPLNKSAVQAARAAAMPSTGLLMLYPIFRDSKPASKDPIRLPLEAVDTVLGVGLVFPEMRGDEGDFAINSLIKAASDALEPEELELLKKEAQTA